MLTTQILGNFATIYALSCGEKLSPIVHMWKKMANMRPGDMIEEKYCGFMRVFIDNQVAIVVHSCLLKLNESKSF